MREKSWLKKHLASFGAPVMYSVDKKMSQFIKITSNCDKDIRTSEVTI